MLAAAVGAFIGPVRSARFNDLLRIDDLRFSWRRFVFVQGAALIVPLRGKVLLLLLRRVFDLARGDFAVAVLLGATDECIGFCCSFPNLHFGLLCCAWPSVFLAVNFWLFIAVLAGM